ncbi:phenylalanine--tRNA ligase subunit beta [Egibacter rhizosphaerae]|uniref:Phenylalanine--tRNA ligase beta subunit n=1 Tax=Egibacter rhizosphaerae TaxID=1670831 RepID=A0A411YK50_9ACTN|nr:phenylalanine--tRNA ligase subunit beta [Egibacter rhizosphaerae]QBI21561.1 phenylalanine--tRNA ligase subunit beta [Egibacter rhizosphaerae]
MRVPYSWLREHVELDLPVQELAERLTLGGIEVDDIVRPTAGTRGVRVLEVTDVEPVEGSDKLHLVEATDGAETWQMVAGASNFGPGDRVPGALPGATLPGGLEVGRRTLFGHTSNGMLASQYELGLSDDHSGIWVLERDAPLGADLADWLDLDDPVLVLEVTPDRGYALSIHGLARDIAAIVGTEVHLPEPEAPQGDPGVPVTLHDTERCPRFDARRISRVTVGPSPAWLQRRLAAAGMRPVSNVVDATNHAMLETGNPVHAYDLATLAGPAIEVRTAHPGERLRTLDGVDRALDADDLVICDAQGPVALAGVMGGEATEISAGTSEVLLEVANFSPTTVLRTARRHGLHTEGSRRWEKAVPEEGVTLAATRAAGLIAETSGGEVTGGSDTHPRPRQRPTIHLRTRRAAARLGLDLSTDEQRGLLERIGCEVTEPARDEAAIDVTPPAYRPDLTLEADLHEEIARLHGYERVPEQVPSSGQVGRREPEHEARRAVRRSLAGGGWTEVMPFPFMAEDDLELFGLPAHDRRRQPIPLVNPLSKEEAVLRTTLLPGLLRVVRHNANRQVPDVGIFEVGRVFLAPVSDEPGADGGPDGVRLPAEPLLVGFAATGAFERPRYDRPARPADVFDLLGAVELVREAVGRGGMHVEPTEEAPYHPGRAARLSLDGVALGAVGELHPRVAEAAGVPPRTLVGELRLAPLVTGGVRSRVARHPSPLPGVRFDVAAVVDEAVPAAEVEAAVRAGAGPRLADLRLFDVYRGPSVGDGRKSLAYRVRIEDPERQLTDTDEQAAIDGVEEAVRDRVGGSLRR